MLYFCFLNNYEHGPSVSCWFCTQIRRLPCLGFLLHIFKPGPDIQNYVEIIFFAKNNQKHILGMAFAAWNMVATLVLPFQEIMASWDKDWAGSSNCTFSFLYEQTAPEIQGTQSFGILADALLESFHNVYLYRYSHGSESFALQASEYILSLCSSEGYKLQYTFPSHQEPVCLTRGFIQNCFLRNDHASRLANVRPKTELHQKISEVRA